MGKAYLTSCISGGDAQQRPGWKLTFAYNEEVIASLKGTVPFTDRTWDEVTKTWWVSANYEHDIESLFGNFHALAYQQGRLSI